MKKVILVPIFCMLGIGAALALKSSAVAEVREVLDSIGDLCPECPPLGA